MGALQGEHPATEGRPSHVCTEGGPDSAGGGWLCHHTAPTVSGLFLTDFFDFSMTIVITSKMLFGPLFLAAALIGCFAQFDIQFNFFFFF